MIVSGCTCIFSSAAPLSTVPAQSKTRLVWLTLLILPHRRPRFCLLLLSKAHVAWSKFLDMTMLPEMPQQRLPCMKNVTICSDVRRKCYSIIWLSRMV